MALEPRMSYFVSPITLMSWLALGYWTITSDVVCWDDTSYLCYCFWSMVTCYFSCYLCWVCFIICFISVISFTSYLLSLFFRLLFCLFLDLFSGLRPRLLLGFFIRTSFLIVSFLLIFMGIRLVLRFEDLCGIFSLRRNLVIRLLLINLAYAAISSSWSLLRVLVLSWLCDDYSILTCYLDVLHLIYLWHLPVILWIHF